jgi:hypothetical protein
MPTSIENGIPSIWNNDSPQQNNSVNDDADYNWPPGLVGLLAAHIYGAARKQIKQVALAGSIAYCAGVFGRGYNVSGTGLNQYIALLTETGIGKESATSVPTAFNELLRTQVPALGECISPVFASPQAIHRYMSKTSQCFVSIVPEFGVALQNMCAKYASANDRGLRRSLLQLYNKSGYRDIVQGSVFADGTKDFQQIARPSFSLLGESTQQEFYKAIDEDSIGDGLIPRFTVIEYKGERPRSNRNVVSTPSASLVNSFAEAAAYAKRLEASGEVVNIPFASYEADFFSTAFENECDDLINSADNQITRQLYNRAHMQLWKLAGLLAVGVNYFNPQITIEHLQWAHRLITNSIACVIARFESGKVGEPSLHIQQHEALYSLLLEFAKASLANQWKNSYEANYSINRMMFAQMHVNYRYIHNKLHRQPAFSKAHNTPMALKGIIDDFINSRYLMRVVPDMKTHGNRTGDIWQIQRSILVKC